MQPTPLSDSLPRLRKLVSPYVGIVNRYYELMASPGDAKIYHFASVSAEGRDVIGAGANPYNGGIAFDRDRAFAAALGEVAERYAAAYVDPARLRLAAAAELDQAHVDPEAVGLFAAFQYARDEHFVPFTRDTPVRWVRGHRLPDGAPTLVPAALAFLNDELVPGEARIAYATSSGLACGPTFEEALLSALYELVERDAFLVAWYNRLSCPHIDRTPLPELVAQEQRYFGRTGVPYSALDLSAVLGIPTALVVCRDPSGFVGMSVGAASARTLPDALLKAVREGFQTHAFARQLRLQSPNWSCDDDFERNITQFDDHVLMYTFAQWSERARFIDASTETVAVDARGPLAPLDVSAQIVAITQRLRARGAEVYAVDCTSPDIGAVGLRVVRAFSPQLARLDVAYRSRFLGVGRLRTGAYDAKLLPAPLELDQLNPLPHPFP